MFTVKHINPKGEENISEHQFVIADRTDDHRRRVLVFDDYPNLGKDNSAGIYVGCCGVSTVDTALGMVEETVYVMNRFGSTVATYRL